MRIIAGQFRGRRSSRPKGSPSGRPAIGRARPLFDILEHGEPPVRAARFLDLFCGTGARRHRGLLARRRRGPADRERPEGAAAGRGQPRRASAHRQRPADGGRCRSARRRAPRRFDLVFLDPPYRSGLALPALAGAARRLAGAGGPGRSSSSRPKSRSSRRGFSLEQERRYGAARVPVPAGPRIPLMIRRRAAGSARSRPAARRRWGARSIGTEPRLPRRRASSSAGRPRRTLASGSPRMMAPISSPVRVSCSSSAWRDPVEIVPVLGEHRPGQRVALLDDAADLAVDRLRGRLGDVLRLGHRVAEEDLLLVLAVAHGPELVAHAPVGDHVARDLGRLLDVGGGTGGDLVAAEHLLLGDPAAHGDGDVGLELLAADRDAGRPRAGA